MRKPCRYRPAAGKAPPDTWGRRVIRPESDAWGWRITCPEPDVWGRRPFLPRTKHEPSAQMPNSAEGKPLGATNRLATRLYDARFRPHSPTITEIMQRYSGGTSIKTAPISYNKHKWFTGWQLFAINPFAKPARDKRNGVPPCYAPTAQPRTSPTRNSAATAERP